MNYTHLMPTRYNLSDVDLKKVIAGDALDSAEKKLAAKKVRPGAASWLTTSLHESASLNNISEDWCCVVA